MDGRAGGGDYIASLLSSAPRLDFGVLGSVPAMLDAAAAGGDGGEDCLERFCGDPGFAERAARLSSFSGQRFAGAGAAAGLFGLPPPAPAASNGEFAGSREASSVSDPASAMKDANAKKRKAPAAAKGKGKESSAQVSFALLELLPRLAPAPRFAPLTLELASKFFVLRLGTRRIRTPRGARRRAARGRRRAP